MPIYAQITSKKYLSTAQSQQAAPLQQGLKDKNVHQIKQRISKDFESIFFYLTFNDL